MAASNIFSMIGASASLVLTAVTSVQAAAFIDTTPGDSTQGPFGEPGSSFVGQTITISEENNVLTDFTVAIDGFDDPDVVNFVGIVSEWNSSTFRPEGSVLFRSKPRATNPGNGFEDFRFDTGTLELQADQQYVLYVQALFNGVAGRGAWLRRTDNPIPDGDIVISNDGEFWFTRSQGGVDLAFQANTITDKPELKTAIPEPSSVFSLLVLSSFLGTLTFRRQRHE